MRVWYYILTVPWIVEFKSILFALWKYIVICVCMYTNIISIIDYVYMY